VPAAAYTVAPDAPIAGGHERKKSKRRGRIKGKSRARAKEESKGKRKGRAEAPREAMPFLRGDSLNTDEEGTEDEAPSMVAHTTGDGASHASGAGAGAADPPPMLVSPIRQQRRHRPNGYMDEDGHGDSGSDHASGTAPLNRGGSEQSGLDRYSGERSSRSKPSRHSVSTVQISSGTRRRSISDATGSLRDIAGSLKTGDARAGSASVSVVPRRLPTEQLREQRVHSLTHDYRRAQSGDSLAEAQALHEEQLREQRAQQRTPNRHPRSLRHSTSTESSNSLQRAPSGSSSPPRRALRRPKGRAAGGRD
jgi:hypothetical protein